MSELAASAPAKINLSLDILGRREDGYHELRTVMQTLGLADVVRVQLDASSPGVTVAGPFAEGVPADESNLTWQAAEELTKRTGKSIGQLHVHLTKHIPAAGGLGGGASDAATTLRLLQQAWGASDADVLAAALAAGSDEPFFLRGGTALVEGRGERVTPLPALPWHAVVLFVPRTTLDRKTASLFTAVDQTPYDTGAATEKLLARQPGQLRARDVSNGFERVAFDTFPGLGALRNAVEKTIGEPVRLAGAGPALFWLGPEDDAGTIADASRNLPCTVIRTATVEGPWAP